MDDTPVLSETFRTALGYDIGDLTSLDRLADFVEFMVHPDDKAWFSSGVSSGPTARPPVGHYPFKQVQLRSKTGEYLVAVLDARIHLVTGPSGDSDSDSDSDSDGDFRFMCTVSIAKSSSTIGQGRRDVAGPAHDYESKKKCKQSSAEDMRQLVRTANALIICVDEDGKVDEWNMKAEEIAGYGSDEAMGRDLVEVFIHPDHRVKAKLVLDDALHGRNTANFEFLLVTKLGAPVEVLLNTTPRRDANGVVVGVVGVGQDTTDRKVAELDSYLRVMLDSANAPVFGIDLSGRVNEWNLKAAEVVGFRSDEVMGRDFVEELIRPENRVQVKRVLDNALQGHDTSAFEFPLFTKDQERIDVLLNAIPRLDGHGKISGMTGYVQNITDRKKAEGDLYRVVRDLRLLIDTANAPIFGIDKGGKVNEWNLKAAQIVGYSSDEAMGRDLVEAFVSPEYRSAVKGVLDDALQGRDTSSFEFPLFTKLGGRVEVLLNATPRRDANGAITGMVGVGQDVTDRNKAERESARQASETRFILDAANAPIWAMDMEGKVTAWNQKSVELLGYTTEEVMGNFAADFVIPEWRVRVKGLLDDALQGRATANFEHPIVTKDGVRLDMLLNTTPRRGVNGDITGVVAVCQDITDRKKAEMITAQMASEMRSLIDTANAPIFGICKDGKVNAWNRKSAELMGYTTDEVMGRDLVQEFISPDYRMAVKKVIDDALNGLVTSSFELTLFSKVGIPIDVLLNANPRRNDIGDIVGVVGIGQDLTENRKTMKNDVDLAKVILKTVLIKLLISGSPKRTRP
jgi:PAS domain S-box-containing protein